MLRIKMAVALLSLSAAAFAQTHVKGRVYIDANKNNTIDKNEKGLAGVTVCNGTDVVLTDAQGNYVLPLSDNSIIFVIQPSGYLVPVDAQNKPKSYYIHKPQGSPANFKYKGSEPTGAIPAAVNFGLIKDVGDSHEFRTLIFGDPQPYTLQELSFFDKAVLGETQVIKGVSFGISLGDLVGDNLDLHQPYISVVQKTGIPWYNVMGNHDMNYDATDDLYADETFEKNFGPANYAFNYGQAHFIVLDDILYPDPRDGKGYWGGLRPDQIAFLTNDLKHVPKDKLIVLSLHIPLHTGADSSFRLEDRQQIFNLLKDYDNVLALSAHTHLQRHNFYTQKEGWFGKNPFHEYNAGTTSGDWYSGELNEQGIPVSTMRDGTPKGYAFLNIKGNQYQIDYKVVGKPSEHQMQIFNPKVVAKDKGTQAGIYVNFFMGAEGDTVQYRIDQGEWKTMKYTTTIDPQFAERVYRWDFLEKLIPGRRPSNPVVSTHLWAAPIDTKLALGAHTIEVKATDMFHRVFSAQSTYRIEESIKQEN